MSSTSCMSVLISLSWFVFGFYITKINIIMVIVRQVLRHLLLSLVAQFVCSFLWPSLDCFCLCRWQHLVQTLSFHQPVNRHVCNVVAASQDCTTCVYTKPRTETTTLSGVRCVGRGSVLRLPWNGTLIQHTLVYVIINAASVRKNSPSLGV